MLQNSELLPEFLTLIEQTTYSFTIQELPRKVILLMGSSKAGKTTLLYYLLGKKLNLVTNELGVSVLQSETIFHSATIGDGYESTTVYPNIPTDCGVEGVIIVDMPGFDDTRPTYKLINFYILLQMLKMVQEVHVCQVIDQVFIDSRQFQTQIQKICAFINQNILKTERALSFVITKVEDQECIEKLNANLQQLLTQNQNKKNIQELSAFLKDEKYIFKNQKPIVQQGIKLKQQIIHQSFFVEINKKPQNFLSPSFCYFMIGETNLKQFHEYLSQLISQSEFTILHLIKLFFSMIRYEYRETIALFQDKSIEEIKQSSLGDLNFFLKLIKVNKINQTQLNQIEDFQVGLKSYQKLIGILKLKDKVQLINVIQCFSFYIHETKSQSVFPREFIEKIYSTFKSLKTLLRIFQFINNQLKQQIDKLFNSSILKQQTLQFIEFWHQNTQKLSQKSDLPLIAVEFYQVYCKQFRLAVPAVKQQIVFIYKYKQIRNKKIKQLMNKKLQTPQPKQFKQIKKFQLSYKQIQKLPLNTYVLEFIIYKIPEIKKIDFLSVSLRKIGEIFKSFSYFQEAILCFMALSDHKAISELIQVGLYQGNNISIQFIRQVLIKYLMNTDWLYDRQIRICYNFLSSLAQRKQQFIQFQLEFVDYIKEYSLGKKNLRENIDNKNAAVELFYIELILQRKQKYINLLKIKEKQIQESQCSVLLESSAISQIMK